ncbi:hypothetical protein GA0070621_5085 [Micromonospora narathiwatensis]|uniref:Uncharacterized protein n=1 Tax=Micromonospora narathiwatensis TaxID=299146 RepID=A0A1A9ACK6_9ACTN|nr:hypothetical protein GA0070621_5085 [Micromonospora narathiwatensis]
MSWSAGLMGLNSAATLGPYYASSRCADINIKQTSQSTANSACVRFGSATNPCNYQTVVADGSWHVIATNVKDGTKFYVSLFNGDGGSPSGLLAY